MNNIQLTKQNDHSKILQTIFQRQLRYLAIQLFNYLPSSLKLEINLKNLKKSQQEILTGREFYSVINFQWY